MVSSFSKYGFIGRTYFSTAEAISTIEVFNYLLAEIPRYLQICLKFWLIHNAEIGSNLVDAFCYTLRIYFGGSKITTCLINNLTYYTTKKSILCMEKLHDSISYQQQNAEVPTLVVGSWTNVRTFVVCSQQKSRDTTREI